MNYLAILACGVLSMILGSIWYGPLFGNAWMKLAGIKKPEKITPEIKKMMIRSYGLMFLVSLIMAFVVSNELQFAGLAIENVGLIPVVIFACFQWLGFVVPSTIGSVLWEGRSWKLWFLNAGYTLVQLCLIAAVLSIWK